MPNRPTSDTIKASSARLLRLVTVLSLLLLVLLLLERFGWVVPALVRGTHGSELVRRLGFQFVAAGPEVMYLLSLWWIRQALASFAAGDFYTSIVSGMLRRVGTLLATGAFLNVFLVPSIDRVLGMSPGYWIAFDVSGLVLGAIGLSLVIVPTSSTALANSKRNWTRYSNAHPNYSRPGALGKESQSQTSRRNHRRE